MARNISAIDVVSGIDLGQARTQFCALPHSSRPPSPMSASRRSAASMPPVGCRLKSATCEIGAAPMKLDRSLTCGHTSRQLPQVMHLESSYATARSLSGIRGPGPRS